MKFKHRSYRDKAFRPLPVVHIEDDGELVIIATPWGEQAGATKLIETIIEFYYSIQEDAEVTSPFETLDCIPIQANHIRTSLRLANDVLRKEFNMDQYTSGVELFMGIKINNSFYWVQVGQPHLFLKRPNKQLYPLGYTYDLSLDFSTKNKSLASLPSQLIGPYNTTQFTVQNLRFQKGDQLLLLSSPEIPSSIYNLPETKFELNTISEELSQQNPTLPFWTGLLSL